MNIIFCDIDGVLNSNIGGLEYLETYPIYQLQRIVKETNAMIVISSAWRQLNHYNDLDKMSELFKPFQLDDRIIGITPVIGTCERHEEIEQWMKESPYTINNFVILDDEYETGILEDNLVQTDARYGLNKIDANRAIKILKRNEVQKSCTKIKN